MWEVLRLEIVKKNFNDTGVRIDQNQKAQHLTRINAKSHFQIFKINCKKYKMGDLTSAVLMKKVYY